MLKLSDIIQAVQPQDWLMPVDLLRAYFHIPIAHRCILKFAFQFSGITIKSSIFLLVSYTASILSFVWMKMTAISDCQMHQVFGGMASMQLFRTSPLSWCNTKRGHTIIWYEAILTENGSHPNYCTHHIQPVHYGHIGSCWECKNCYW